MEVGRGEKWNAGGAEWSTGLTALCSLGGRQECLPYLRPVATWLSLPECGFFLNAGEGKWSTGLTALCSLQGRQECLPYLRPVATWLSLPECGFFLNAGGRNGAQALPPCALYWAGRNAYPT